MQRLETISAQKAASKSARMAKLWQFSQGHPKPAFSVKLQTGDQGKFLKKVALVWKAQKHSGANGIIL